MKPRKFSIKPMLAWYDLWMGIYVDVPQRRVYVFPLPCIGIRIDLAINS